MGKLQASVTDTRQVNKQKKRWGGSCLQPMHAQLVANQSILQRWSMLLTENHGIEDVSSALLEDAPMSCLSGACTRHPMATTSATPAMSTSCRFRRKEGTVRDGLVVC